MIKICKCGCHADMHERFIGGGRLYHVACLRCDAKTNVHSYWDMAIKEWNKKYASLIQYTDTAKQSELHIDSIDKRIEALELELTRIKAKLQYLGKGWGEDK